jgi:hypothetical protein
MWTTGGLNRIESVCVGGGLVFLAAMLRLMYELRQVQL